MKTSRLFLLTLLLTIAGSMKMSAQEAYCALEKTEKNNGELESLTAIFYYDNQRSSRSETVNVPDDGGRILKIPQEIALPDYINVVFDSSFANYCPTSTNSWFFWLQARVKVSFSGWENLNTSQVKDMSSMFYALGFYETNEGHKTCEVENLDLSHFNTSMVTDMRSMFNYVYLNDDLDISSFTINPGTLTGSMMSNSHYRSITLPASAINLADDAFLYSGSAYNPITLYCPEDITTDPTYITNPSFHANGESKGDSIEILAYRVSENNVRKANISEGEGYNGTSCYKELSDVDVVSEDGPKAWDSQLFVYTPDHYWHEGDRYTFKMRVRANQAASLSVQAHGSPTGYQHWYMLDGEYDITTEWQEIVCNGTITADQVGSGSMRTITFLLNFNNEGKGDIVFYFDDISWEPDNGQSDIFVWKNGTFRKGGQPYVVYRTGDKSMTFYCDDNRPAESETLKVYDLNTIDKYGSSGYPEWYSAEVDGKSVKSSVKTVNFDESFSYYHPITCNNWFSQMVSLTDIQNIQYLNTDKVKDMSYMFRECSSLTSLDVSYFDTRNVENMSVMFYYCNKLTSLDVSNFDTSKVTSMVSMFNYCTKLENIDVSHFDTSNVTGMNSMFNQCLSLKSLDVSHFNTSKVTGMMYMFYQCSSLKSLDLSNFTFVEDGGNYSNFIAKCTSLKMLTVPATSNYLSNDAFTSVGTASSPCVLSFPTDFSPSNVTYYETYMEWNGGFFAYYPYVQLDENSTDEGNVDGFTLTFYCDSHFNQRPGTAYPLNAIGENPGWYGNQDVKKVVFDESFSRARPDNTYHWFALLANLKTIDNIMYLNTSNVTSMAGMFALCAALESLYLDFFDTSNVTDMSDMFNACIRLSSLYISNFDTSNVTKMDRMFADCRKLQSLDLRHFVLNNTSTERMMYRCYGLRDLSIPKTGESFDASACEEVGTPEKPCALIVPWPTQLTTKESHGSYFNWKKGCFTDTYPYALLTETELAFIYDDQSATRYGEVYALNYGDTAPRWTYGDKQRPLRRVVFDQSFANARPESTNSWFSNMINLENIEGIEHLNTEEVTNMNFMFSSTYGLKDVDLSHFETSKVKQMVMMFYLSGLESIDVSNFDTSNVENAVMMFDQCSNLQELDLSHFTFKEGANSWWLLANCPSLKKLTVPSTANLMDSDACYGVGTVDSPCQLNYPNDLTLEGKTPDNGCFKWKGGYFKEAPYAVLSTDKKTLTFYNDNAKESHGGKVYSLNEEFNYPDWLNDVQFTKVVFDPSFADARPTTCFGWFSGKPALTNVEGLQYLDTSEATTLNYMFDSCISLQSLDLSHLTIPGNTMYFLYDCRSLKKLTVPVTASNLSDGACYNVGTVENPCVLIYPESMEWDRDNYEGYFVWKGGYFTDVLAGDANSDGYVTVADVMLTVNRAMNKPVASFNEKNADINNDGRITVADVMGIVKLVLSSGSKSAPRNAFQSMSDAMAVTAKGNELTLHLTGTGSYTASQMMLTLPEGCRLESAQMVSSRSNGHSVQTSDLGNGQYRVVVYGASGMPFGNSCSDLVRLNVKGSHHGDVAVSDIQVVDYFTNTFLLSDVSGIATGIDSIGTGTDGNGDWYTTQGQKVTTPTRGVYIRNGQKVVVR